MSPALAHTAPAPINPVDVVAASIRLAVPDHGEADIQAAARELAAQEGDFAVASVALQNDRCWGAYHTLMAYRAALTPQAA